MSDERVKSSTPSFLRTVLLLLSVAQKRAMGRMRRQQQLLQHRTGSSTNTLGGLGFVLVVMMMAVLNGGASWVVHKAVQEGQRHAQEQDGKVVVSEYFAEAVRDYRNAGSEEDRSKAKKRLEKQYGYEARSRSRDIGGSEEENEQFLRLAVANRYAVDFVEEDTVRPGIGKLASSGSLPAMLGSLVIFWWLIMLIFQGEGLELDLQRRRHPMWEWLFSHPVKPGAVFLAEMTSPVAANPIYATGPLFFGFLYGTVYGAGYGFLATFLIGVPVSLATACIGKAMEMGIMLRFPPRSRGAIIGFMSWLGYAAMMSFIFGAFAMPKIVNALGDLLTPMANAIPWPWLGWFIGAQADGSFSFLSGLLVCWVVSVAMIFVGVKISVWGAQKGLTGNTTSPKLSASQKKANYIPRFGRDPLYRKEILWFLRDRSAIVQTILIPLTIASVQLFNLRGILEGAQGSWHYLSGAAMMFGTYFLWILGPRSLASEGPALWLAQTWPRGMEDLMKAKARLWFLISTGIVMLVLGYAAYKFPSDSWKVLLVAIGWVAFGRSMAEKSVTLVSATSSSGEPEPIPKGRRWAASLGMLTFGIGILTQRWHLAVVGIVYSWMTAAAMWQNFRARLPFLFDPWSEKVPPPPTLMHSMIAISALVEVGAILTGIFVISVGAQNIPVAQALAYATIAGIVSLVVANMLADRGLQNKDVWSWRGSVAENQRNLLWWCGDGSREQRYIVAMGVSIVTGILLALFAHGYLMVLSQFETFGEMLRVSKEHLENLPGLRWSYFFMAVGVAPFAEEYLFRGLLFRALDKEWGGWRALAGSAAFFAIYHPPMAWLPVGLLGLITAYIFKKTGRLAPAVALHMAYNAVVLM